MVRIRRTEVATTNKSSAVFGPIFVPLTNRMKTDGAKFPFFKKSIALTMINKVKGEQVAAL